MERTFRSPEATLMRNSHLFNLNRFRSVTFEQPIYVETAKWNSIERWDRGWQWSYANPSTERFVGNIQLEPGDLLQIHWYPDSDSSSSTSPNGPMPWRNPENILNRNDFQSFSGLFFPQNDVSWFEQLVGVFNWDLMLGSPFWSSWTEERATRLFEPLAATSPISLGFRQSGGSIVEVFPQLARLSSLKSLDASSCLNGHTVEGTRHYVECSDLSHLIGLKDLEHISLGRQFVKGDGIKTLAKLPRLRELNLNGSFRLTDDDLKNIADLYFVEYLKLGYCEHLTDKCMEYIAKMPSLKFVELGQNKFTDKGIGKLKNSKTLQSVSLNHLRQLTNRSIKDLSGISTLEELNLYSCPEITNINCLDSERIRSLDLRESGVPAGNLSGFLRFKNLKQLYIYANPSPEILANLSKLLQLEEYMLQRKRLVKNER